LATALVHVENPTGCRVAANFRWSQWRN